MPRAHLPVRLVLVAYTVLAFATLAQAQSAVDGFDPGANSVIRTMALQPDGKLLVGGAFTTLGGGGTGTTTRNRIGRLNPDGSLDAGFDPGANGTVTRVLLQADGKILIGGDFTMVGGGTGTIARARIARLNANGSVDPTFNPGADNDVDALALQADGKILVGGEFTMLGGAPRVHFGRLNGDGSIDGSFSPGNASFVLALAIQPTGQILVGGCGMLRRFNVDGSLDVAFDPGVNGCVTEIALEPDMQILVGGTFTTLGGGGMGTTTRHNIGRLGQNGSLDPGFDPGANDQVRTIVVQPDGRLLVGGAFTMLGGGGTGSAARSHLGRLEPDGSLDAGFDPGASNWVHSLLVQPDGTIVVAGEFMLLGGGGAGMTVRERIGRVYADGSLDLDFNPGVNDRVFTMALQADGRIVAGGDFTTIGGGGMGMVARQRLARLNPDGSVDLGFNPGANGTVLAVIVQPDGKILVGGQFSTLAGVPRPSFGRLNADGSLDTSFTPNVLGIVAAVALQPDGKIVIGAGATQDGATRGPVSRLNPDGTLDLGFVQGPPASGPVFPYTLAVQQDGKILVGGYFPDWGGRHYLARLGTDGLPDASFNPDATVSVTAIAVQPDGGILISGGVTAIGRLNTDGSIDTSFNPAADNGANTFALQADGKILVGGWFTTLANASRNHIGRLNPDGSLDVSFDAGTNGAVRALVVQADGKIVVGGDSFTTLGGGGTGMTLRRGIGRLTNTGTAAERLGLTDGNTAITWTRGGAGPDVWRTTFDVSTDAVSYSPLGIGTRVAGGWQLTLQNLPVDANVFIRARGYYTTGNGNDSSSIAESVRNVYLPSSCAPIALSATVFVPGSIGTTYPATTVTQAGGLAPTTFAITGGALPWGLTLSSGGTVSGTPLAAGTFTFWVTATGANGCTGSRSYALVVTAPVPAGFAKVAPGNGSANRPLNPTAVWTASAGAASYQVCIDGTANGACDTTWLDVGPTTSSTLSGLAPGATYSWQVRAVNASGVTSADSGTWWTFTTTAFPNSMADLAIDFGPGTGLWALYDAAGASTWQQLHNVSPSLLRTGDLDGNGLADLVLVFPGAGVWAFMNNSAWSPIHPFDASEIQAADLDGNGRDELVVNFPGAGLWVRFDDGSWQQIHPLNANRMIVGDIGAAVVVVNFPGYGIWAYLPGGGWVPLHPFAALDLQGGDLDGNGIDDLIVQFSGLGEWILYNAETWVPLHGLAAQGIVTGNIDGDAGGRADIVINFPGQGVWAFLNNTTWVQLHGFNATVMATGDLDGNGADDLILHFPGYGIWTLRNLTTWTPIHPLTPEAFVSGRMNAN